MADFDVNSILTLASGIYDDINSPTSLSVGYISGVLTSSGFLGSINSRINSAFTLSGDGPTIVGGFGDQESQIASLQFQVTYYGKQSLAALQGLAGAGYVTSLKEGDSALTRESPVKASAEWRGLRKEMEETLRVAVANYLRSKSLSVSVDASQLAAYPTP